MKKIRFGFTLAEVATAMTIVGVVAALVLPLVAKGVQRQQTGPILGRAVAQIEAGNQNIMQLANMNSESVSYSDTLVSTILSDIGFEGGGSVLQNFNNIVPAYWGLNETPIEDDDVIEVKSFNGGNGGTDAEIVEDSTKYSFATFSAAVSISPNAVPEEDKLDTETGIVIYIDTNGWNTRPNMAGKDVFAFNLLNNGSLKPATGTDAGDYAERVVKAGFKVNY